MAETAHQRHLMTEVAMRRRDLLGLPPVTLPDGYAIRHSRPGDEHAWCAVISAAFPEEPPATLQKWQNQIVAHRGYRPEHVFFITDPAGRPCATASAMRGDRDEEGYIHWVAVDPAHAGRKLGLLASLQTLHCFAARGCTTATLVTNTFRLPAVRIYLRLGFVPRLTKPEHAARWQVIAGELGETLPEACVEYPR